MTNENPTGNSELGEAHATSSGEAAAVSGADTLSLAELNQFLGKDFKDKETALKSLKDTQSFVGKRSEDIEAEVRAKLAQGNGSGNAAEAPASKSEVRSLRNDLFFRDNPQYAPHRALIEKLGEDPAEVVGSQEFKDVFEKVKVADEVESKKSVVHSSSRLGQSNSVVDEAVKVANARGTTGEDVAATLARGINVEINQS